MASVQPVATRPHAALLVEDEIFVRDAMRRRFERAGYEVREADSAASALALFRADPSAFDVVVIDLSLPDASGLGVLDGVLGEQPQQVVLLTSGCPDDALAPLLASNPRLCFLQKPYGGNEMLRVVGELLERTGAES